MYKIYCDGELIYHPTVEELTISAPKLSLEVNKSGSFDFKIYPKHPKYASIKKLKSVIEIFQDEVRLFRGRVLDFKIDFYNAKIVVCEGDLGFLNDSIVRPYQFQGTVIDYLKLLLECHNSQVEENKKFYLGNVTVTDQNDYITRSDSTYPSTWTIIEEKLISKLGGYLVIRRDSSKNYLDYLVDSEYKSNQVIQFGENLLDVSQFIKGKDIKTAIIPVGAEILDDNGEGMGVKLDIRSINDGKDYVYNQEAVDIFGWIYDVVEFKDVTVVENLKRKGEEYLAKSILSDFTIELNAIDLSMIDVSIDEFRIFEYVKIKSLAHKLDDMFLIKKLDIDLINPQNNKVTVGTELKSFTDKDFSDKNTIKDVVSDFVLNETKDYIKDSIDDINSHMMYRVEIMSSNGNIFKNGEIDTELRAVLYSWDKNITDEFGAERFKWTRISDDLIGDESWNSSHFGGAKTIHITSNDIHARATFQVDVLDETGKSILKR